MVNRYLSAFVLLAACTGATNQGPAITTRTPTTIAPQQRIDLTHENVINTIEFPSATRDQLWQAVLEAHKALGSSIVALEEKAGLLRFQLESKTGSLLGKGTGHYIDCALGPAGPRVNTHRVTIKITHAVESTASNSSRLLTMVAATARSPGMSSDPIQCSSLGTLEKQITGMIATRLN